MGTGAAMYPIADNGGATWTQALSFASSAIDAADPEICVDFDQRGVVRPEDGDDDETAVCDMGAFEDVIAATEFVFIPIVSQTK